MSDEERKVLINASVIGREFEFDILQESLGIDEERLLSILERFEHKKMNIEPSQRFRRWCTVT